MGLLGKAIALHDAHAGSAAFEGAASGGESFIADFHHKNPQFHAIVLQGSGAHSGIAISDMISCHGGEVADLPDGNTLVLLPGALDRELFAHRIAHSAGLAAIAQLSADSPALALETLGPYLQ